MADQTTHDPDAGGRRGAKMVGAPGEIGLEQIVGFDPDLEQSQHQGLDAVKIVIDPF